MFTEKYARGGWLESERSEAPSTKSLGAHCRSTPATLPYGKSLSRNTPNHTMHSRTTNTGLHLVENPSHMKPQPRPHRT